MTQANESLNLTASQHIERIYEHAHRPIFDYALVNTAPVSQALLDRYAGEGASPIVADIEAIEALGVRCIAGDFAAEGDVVRHAADRVADAVLRLGVSGAVRERCECSGHAEIRRSLSTTLRSGIDGCDNSCSETRKPKHFSLNALAGHEQRCVISSWSCFVMRDLPVESR